MKRSGRSKASSCGWRSKEDTYTVQTDVDPADAQAWWDTHRPLLPNVLVPDLEYDALENVLEMDVDETSGPLAAKFGGKAANLAKMFSFLPAEYQVPGFAIPFRYYHEFMTSNLIADDRFEPPVLRTYEDYLRSLLEDPRFQSDGQYRAERLDDFRDTMRDDGVVDPVLVQAWVTRITEVFGSPSVMVRFRSSSNNEDSVIFIGAGLYDSTSVCVEDSLDGDNVGPSRCDPNQLRERTIERGLKKVWASLWNFRAYEERSYFQVPQQRAKMAILVTPAFPAEASNGVAFTGDPIVGRSSGYVINAQTGDESVVYPDVNVLPEKDILTIRDGEVSGINRVRPSSLMPPGEQVLSDEQLRTLGRAMAIVDEGLMIDLEGHDREDVVVDIEFKFTREGDLIFKQARPFLRSTLPPPQTDDFFQMVIPDEITFCEAGIVGTLRTAYEHLAQIDLQPGMIYLPKHQEEIQADVIKEFRIGPDQTIAQPQGQGRFTRTVFKGDDKTISYGYECEQAFLAGEEMITIGIHQREYHEGDPPFVIDEDLYTDPPRSPEFVFEIFGETEVEYFFMVLSACELPTPLFMNNYQFADGGWLNTFTRVIATNVCGARANFVFVEGWLPELSNQRFVQDDFFCLATVGGCHYAGRVSLSFLIHPSMRRTASALTSGPSRFSMKTSSR